MIGLFTQNPAFIEYESLLINLHRLIAQGNGESEAADGIRQRMEVPERQLSQTELDQLDGLSGDLYMLSGKELPEPSSPDDSDPVQVEVRLAALLSHGDWVNLLDALRTKAAFKTLKEEFRAFLRAQAYAGLGQTDTALLFVNHALFLNPGEPAYQYHRLSYLFQLAPEQAQRETTVLSHNFATAKNAAILSELAASTK